ncbi:MAG: alpha/beta hydrolase [Hyphomicrobiaceae bacterium]
MLEFSPELNIAIIIIAAVFSITVLWWISKQTSTGTGIAIVALACLVVAVVWVAGGKDFDLLGQGEKSARPPPAATETAKANGERNTAQPPAVDAKPREAAPDDGLASGKPVAPRPEVNERRIVALEQEKWDVVPIYYGTDRARKDAEKRIAYGTDRGRRLEIGRAMVTIPKNHKVPNIERPWVYKLPFTSIVLFAEKEDPEKHFTMRELAALTKEEFARLARERISAAKLFPGHALLFVHGFNTTFDYAVFRAAQLSYDLKFDGGSFVYSWPSRGEVSPTGYSADRESAEQAEQFLSEFVTLVAKQTGATSLTVIAHSMGNKLLLPVLRNFNQRNDVDVKISQLILAAPDVDRDTFEGLAKQIDGIAKGITLYAAANDIALDVSRQFWGGVPRAGDIPETGPLVVPGIDTIDITATKTEYFSLNHTGYAEKTELLSDIRSLMVQGYQPPKTRLPSLIEVPTQVGAYWKFP